MSFIRVITTMAKIVPWIGVAGAPGIIDAFKKHPQRMIMGTLAFTAASLGVAGWAYQNHTESATEKHKNEARRLDQGQNQNANGRPVVKSQGW